MFMLYRYENILFWSINRDFYLDHFLHHFKLDSINNMDHMRISGTEPLSVILCQTQ